MPIDVISTVRVQLCSIYEILFILLCVIELELVRMSMKEHVHQEFDTFGEGQIRINIVPNGTDMNMSLLVRTIDIINRTARYIDCDR
jgi:hypothetical protein